MTFTITVEGLEEPIIVENSGSSIHSILKDYNLINALCGGKGICGKCRIQILSGLENVNPRNDQEEKILGNTQENIRLACLTYPTNNIKLRIVDRALQTDSIFKTEDSRNFELGYPFSPRFQRITSMFAKEEGIHGEVIYDYQDKIPVEGPSFSLLGVIFDIGTTSIAGTLIDLENGFLLATSSILNPQIVKGRDIMSRLTWRYSHPDDRYLQQKVFKGLKELLNILTQDSKQISEAIREIIVVGNTVMHHLFLHLSIDKLGRSPYLATTTEEISLNAADLNLDQILGVLPTTKITCLPLIASFIGSDASADILYQQLHKIKGKSILIDFGTNSEIIFSNDGELFVTSVAAGGAFEGQHISCGMRGVNGAIERVSKENGKLKFSTIDNTEPIGICGTGIIELIAELLDLGYLNSTGQLFDTNGERITEYHIEGSNLTITRKDIEEIQKAKAAVQTALRLILKKFNLDLSNIDSIIIAGVFGSKLNIEKAQKIGLLPKLNLEKYKIAGNTAEKGARTALLSIEARKELRGLVKKIKKIDLISEKEFQKYFTEELFFPKK